MRLTEFRENVYSQNGEDGVIRELVRRLKMDKNPGQVVEFGAWDGIHLSNTFALVEGLSWRALYIEGDPEKYGDLVKTSERVPTITPVNAWILTEPGGTGSDLDLVIQQHGVPNDFEILSIDIDSFDLDVWARLQAKPKIVVIEINSAIEPGIIRWHGRGKLSGNSFSATLAVATAKGYTLVCHTGNMIFVRDDLRGLVGLDYLDLLHPERLFLPDWVGLSPSLKERTLRIPTLLPPGVKRIVRRALGMRPVTYGS